MPNCSLFAIIAVGDGRAGREVLPFELELDVGVLAVLRQIFLQQLELADDGAGRHRVGGGVLRADADRDDGLRAGGDRPACAAAAATRTEMPSTTRVPLMATPLRS